MTSDYQESNEVRKEKYGKDDLDMAKIQDAMQGKQEQQRRELQEDSEKFNNRPKPAWAEAVPQDLQKSGQPVNEGVHWQNRDVVDVPVADLPWPEGVRGPQDFNHHISYPETVRAMNELQQMKPMIEKGYTSNDFALIDRTKGVDYANGQQRIYDLFYGSDAIKVDKDGNHYDIVNGRHRIFVAKEKGYDFIPAHVTEKVQSQENK